MPALAEEQKLNAGDSQVPVEKSRQKTFEKSNNGNRGSWDNTDYSENERHTSQGPTTPLTSVFYDAPARAISKRYAQDPVAKLKYLWKPSAFAITGVGLTCFGITFTVYHFLFEDSLAADVKNPPYFTFGPIGFALGLIVFMIGIVWFSMKHTKWVTGKATPILRAAAASATVVTSVAIHSEAARTPSGDDQNAFSAC